MRSKKVDKLTVKTCYTRKEMGEVAAMDIAKRFKTLLKTKDEINVIFAAAPSQNDVLKSLVENKKIEWGRINAYQMDEYIGLKKDVSQTFGNFLYEHLFSLVPLKSINLINPEAEDCEKEAERYSCLLRSHPIDVVIIGIGENGHVAFNDPPVADFKDKKAVKAVQLDDVCRIQQVNDGRFKSVDKVPMHALTLTVPTIFNVPNLFCVVPAPTKAKAVKEALTGTIDEHCPASILRLHDNAILYLDKDSASLL